MNTETGDKLKISAETGDIELLYEVIQDDPSILENIDKNQFVETPLHISASECHIKYAIEIMNLKPSFATKLNMEGKSPIQLATENLRTNIGNAVEANNLKMMVSIFVGINKDLVRVKGRGGFTPLHFACQIGEVDLLAEFLTACPNSIEDITVIGHSALYLAVVFGNYEALRVLVGFLKESCQRGARKLEEKILNQKDLFGNTVLHVSASLPDPEFLRFLVQKTRIKLNTKNLENKTALDLASTPENQNILMHAKAKHGSEMKKARTRAEELRSETTIIENMIPWVRRIVNDITEEQRNTWLVVSTLVATATYESALNPPGGVFQVSASDDNNMKTSTTYDFFSTRGNAGKSILSRDSFMVFSLANMLSFCVSIIAILILTPGGAIGRLVIFPVSLFVCCYLIAMPAISPTHANTIILYIPMYSIVFIVVICFTCKTYIKIIWKDIQKRYKARKERT